MSNFKENIMKEAIEIAATNSEAGLGGPFGAAVVKDGKLISLASNNVLGDNDPTAHAEICAIRAACKTLDTYDLSGCELYATGFPCPMCLSAIIWANIKTVYYCNDVEAAEQIGFRDTHIYDFIMEGSSDKKVLEIHHLPLEQGQKLYDDYHNFNKKIY